MSDPSTTEFEIFDCGQYLLYPVNPEKDKNRWLKGRRLPASDLAEMLGLSPWRTAEEQADILVGNKEPSFTVRQQGSMQRGTRREPLANQHYSSKYVEPYNGKVYYQPGIVWRKDFPLLTGSPDAFVNDDGGAEYKCPDEMPAEVKLFLAQLALGKTEEELGLAHIPRKHYYQIQAYLWITGRPWWDYSVYIEDLNSDFTQRIYFQEKHWQEYVIPKLQQFIVELLVPRLQARVEQGLPIPEHYRSLLH